MQMLIYDKRSGVELDVMRCSMPDISIRMFADTFATLAEDGPYLLQHIADNRQVTEYRFRVQSHKVEIFARW